jgi:HEAT repeat protein
MDGLNLACQKDRMEWEQLASQDEAKALEAIEKAEELGDIRWVRPLLEAYRDTGHDTVRRRIAEVLGSLKLTAAEDVLVDALDDPDFRSMQADVIGFLWNAGFVDEAALRSVVMAAVEGDFQVALEALTWVDQIEQIENEHALLESILMVRGGLEDPAKASIHGLLAPMLVTLESHERGQ